LVQGVVSRHERDRYARGFDERHGGRLADGEQTVNWDGDVRAEAVRDGYGNFVANLILVDAFADSSNHARSLHSETVAVVRPFHGLCWQEAGGLQHVLEVQGGRTDADLHFAGRWRLGRDLVKPQCLETSGFADLKPKPPGLSRSEGGLDIPLGSRVLH